MKYEAGDKVRIKEGAKTFHGNDVDTSAPHYYYKPLHRDAAFANVATQKPKSETSMADYAVALADIEPWEPPYLPQRHDKVRILAKYTDNYATSIENHDEAHYVTKVGEVSSRVRSESGAKYVFKNHELALIERPNSLEYLRMELAAKREERDKVAQECAKAYETQQRLWAQANVLEIETTRLEAEFERQREIAELEHRLAALKGEEMAQGIEVGAIVDFDWSGGRRRGRVTGVNEDGVVVDTHGSTGAGYPVPNHVRDNVKLVYPASHPVAQSLVSRKSGEYRTGDVVELIGSHPRAGKTVLLKREYASAKGFDFGDDEYGFYPINLNGRLITPRELRVDLTEDEWRGWFPQQFSHMSDEARQQTFAVRKEDAA